MPPRDHNGKLLPPPKLDEWTLHVLKTIRCDLAWAVCTFNPHWRLKSGIKMVTDLLGDDAEWEKMKAEWEKEDPGTLAKLYDLPPEINPAP